MKNTHEGVLLLVSNTPPWYLKLYKWYQIAQSITYVQDVFIGEFILRIRLNESVEIWFLYPRVQIILIPTEDTMHMLSREQHIYQRMRQGRRLVYREYLECPVICYIIFENTSGSLFFLSFLIYSCWEILLQSYNILQGIF